MHLYSKKVRNTIFACARKLMFPRYLFFTCFKIFEKNVMVFNKICCIYPTVHQLWSKAHQLVNIYKYNYNLFAFLFFTLCTTNLQIDKTNFSHACILLMQSISNHRVKSYFSGSYFHLLL